MPDDVLRPPTDEEMREGYVLLVEDDRFETPVYPRMPELLAFMKVNNIPVDRVQLNYHHCGTHTLALKWITDDHLKRQDRGF
jgi:hypothetical protein